MCATGSESFRNACYAVASGAFDVVMATGVEKLKDGGFSGLVVSVAARSDGTDAELTAPALFSLLGPAYCKKYGVDPDEFKDVISRIAWKNHQNGALEPTGAVPQGGVEGDDRVLAAHGGQPRHLRLLGRVRRRGGRGDRARRGRVPVHRQAALREGRCRSSPGPRPASSTPTYDYTTFREVVAAAEDAYQQAGVTDPRAELAMAEVHDCFTPTELVLMEDLGFAERGFAWKEVLAGTFDLDGELPVNPDGGLKAFGHPIGASGLRMLFECWLQLRDEAGERQIKTVAEGKKLALTHNLGGYARRVRELRRRGRLGARRVAPGASLRLLVVGRVLQEALELLGEIVGRRDLVLGLTVVVRLEPGDVRARVGVVRHGLVELAFPLA